MFGVSQPSISNQTMCEAMGCCFDGAASGTQSAPQCFYGTDAKPIKRVHMIQASHFDAGFANSLVGIANLWFHTHYPRALKIGKELDALGGNPRMRFMTQSYLVSLFLNCPPTVGIDCPTEQEVADFKESVSKGYLTWHAFPHNAELGSVDSSLLNMGVTMTHDLDGRLSVRNKTVVSQRDVPGAPRSVLRAFKQAGVRAFSVGVNDGSTAPLVPRAFRWRDEPSGTEMLTLYHPHGYGGFDLPDAIILPGCEDAAILAWRGDNAGPAESVAEVLGWWAQVQLEFPGAEVITSDFEAFVDAVEEQGAAASLPVITKEIGDTWVYGVPSDPVKRAYGHVAMNARTACLADGTCAGAASPPASDGPFPALYNFSRLLVKIPEHTDGRDVKTFLHDDANWTNVQFQAALAADLPNYRLMTESWQEQRNFSVFHPLRALLQEWLEPAERDEQALRLAKTILKGWSAVDGGAAARRAGIHLPADAGAAPSHGAGAPACGAGPVTVGPYTIGWNATTGAVTTLSRAGQAPWASESRPALVPQYNVYSAANYTDFIFNYSSVHPPPSYLPKDFGKPGVPSVAFQSTSSLVSATCEAADDGTIASVELTLRLNRDAVTGLPLPAAIRPTIDYGAPAAIVLRIEAPDASSCGGPSAACALPITVRLVNKTSTRMPEALFLRFNPAPGAPDSSQAGSQWRFHAVDSPFGTDPADVQLGGNRRMHAVSGPVTLRRAAAASSDGFCVTPIDSRVVSFGEPTGYPTPIDADVAAELEVFGTSLMLSNNMWGTNYPQWTPVFGQPLTLSYRLTLGTTAPFAC